MLKLIVGAKGSGKTSRLVDDLNKKAQESERNVICIERGNRLDLLLKHNIRLVDISEYPVNSLDQLLSFVAGMNSRDYDITHVYIDSIFKVAGVSEDMDKLLQFLEKLVVLSNQTNTEVSVIVNGEKADFPENLQQYIQA